MAAASLLSILILYLTSRPWCSVSKLIVSVIQALWSSVRGMFGRRRETPTVMKQDASTAQTVALSTEEETA